MLLSSAAALIFRITHIANVPWLLANGLHCRSHPQQDPGFVQIGNPDLIVKRADRTVPVAPGGTLADYVPFYFTPLSPMLLNIKTGRGVVRRPMSELVILVTSLHELVARQIDFAVADRHAYLEAAQFSKGLDQLATLDWKNLQARDFKRDPNDPGKFERYQAEALAHREVPASALREIVSYSPEENEIVGQMVQNAHIEITVAARPEWFFG